MALLTQQGFLFFFLLFDGIFKSFVEVFLMAFCNDSVMIKAETGFEFGISESKEGVQAFQQDKVMIFREIMKFFFSSDICVFGVTHLWKMARRQKSRFRYIVHCCLNIRVPT